MVTQAMLKKFGQMLKSARLKKQLSQEQVASAIGMTQGQYSDIERAYVRPGQTRGTVPDDEFLMTISSVLEITIHDLHAALGRTGGSAAALVREKMAEYDPNLTLPAEQIDELSTEAEDFVRVRIERQAKQLQGAR